MAKIKHRACKSIKEFKKICRKYGRYFGIKGTGKYNYQHHWYTWIWIDIDNPWNEELIAYADRVNGNLPSIVKTVQNNYGWSFEHNGIVYYLRGIEISNEDYYYTYISKDGKRQYLSCVGKFDSIA